MIRDVVGIIGWPVDKSLSPIMHQHAFKALGLSSWCYVPMPVAPHPPGRIEQAVLGLRALGFRGANVTAPYKEAVIPHMDAMSERAQVIGAINTIAIDDQGQLVGHNTDGEGFIRDLRERRVKIDGASVLILGAGGASRAIAHGLLSRGLTSLFIANRTKGKALKMRERFHDLSAEANIDVVDLDELASRGTSSFDLIVNTTGDGIFCWLSRRDVKFLPHQLIYDLSYAVKEPTEILKLAARGGSKTLSGLGMLLHQGALSFEIWTNKQAPLDAMRKAIGLDQP